MVHKEKQHDWNISYEVTLVNGCTQPRQLKVQAADALEAMAEADALMPDLKANPEVETLRVLGVTMISDHEADQEADQEDALEADQEDDQKTKQQSDQKSGQEADQKADQGDEAGDGCRSGNEEAGSGSMPTEAAEVLKRLPRIGLPVNRDSLSRAEILGAVLPWLVPRLECGYGDIVAGEWHDLTVLFGFRHVSQGDSGIAFINKTLLSDAGITPEELTLAALVNLHSVAKITSLEDALHSEAHNLSFDSDNMLAVIEPPAAVMLGRTVLRYVSIAMGGPLVIAPVSLREMVAVRNLSPGYSRHIAGIHKLMQPEVSSNGLWLGDSIYAYLPEAGDAVIADTDTDRQQDVCQGDCG